MSTPFNAPGRLGDPSMTLQTDPRTHPDMLLLLQALQAAELSDAPIPASDATPESLEPTIAASNASFQQLYDTLPNELPSDKSLPSLDRITVTIPGLDGNEIALHVFRPAQLIPSAMPAIIYYHGGGMTILNTVNRVHERWCISLATQGVVVVMVDFRNAYAQGGNNVPFPAGLNDCVSAAKYVHERRSEWNLSKIVLQGESGGANLSIAVALRAKREGWVDAIDGVSAQIPYISGGYGWDAEKKKTEKLLSLIECDGYFLTCGGMAALAIWYTPEEKDKSDALAWPFFATVEDVKGLPPHYISVAELDPLKDEGITYHRTLLAAGVRSTAEVALGLVHGAFLFFRQALPSEHDKQARNVVAFAKNL